MGESLKALMEASPEYRNYFVFDSVVAAVRLTYRAAPLEEAASHSPFDFQAVPVTAMLGS